MLRILLHIFILIHYCYSFGNNNDEFLPKCCDNNEELIDNVSCKNKTNSRLEINLNYTSSFLKNNFNNSGQCVDSNGRNFNVYEINNKEIIQKNENATSKLSIFPKCCPLNYSYYKNNHSCINKKSLNNKNLFMMNNNQLFKIGIPHCKLISDKFFDYEENVTYYYYWKLSKNENNSLNADFCLDNNFSNNTADDRSSFVIRECEKNLNICEQKRCFRKCCPDGQSFVGGASCKDTFVHGIQLKSTQYSSYIEDVENDDEHELIYDAKCAKVSLISNNTIQYSITKTGTYKYYHNMSGKFDEKNYSNLNSYCLEYVQKGNLNGYFIFGCLIEPPLEAKFTYTIWAKIFCCILLMITIIVYFYLDELKTTFGKILVNYCIAMISLMITLTVIHLHRSVAMMECKIQGFSLIFFNIASFAWVNVMSMDISWTFGTSKCTIGNEQRKKDCKKFFLYFLYGWGIPIFHTILIFILYSYPILPESIQPKIGKYKCYIENSDNYGHTVFIVIPQIVFQLINIILFIKTIIYYLKVKNEINRMNDSTRTGEYKADKGRLILVIKLAVIMGLVWTWEVLSAALTNQKNNAFIKYIEIIFDTITCLQGFFIFLIFIFKRKILIKLKRKLGIKERRPSGSTSITHSTNNNGQFPMKKKSSTNNISENRF